MIIAIANEQGFVSAHFGRCPAYTIVEIEDDQVRNRQEIPNPGHQPGFLPQYLSEKGVQVIVAGGMGPMAQNLFAEKNIDFIIGVQGPIDEIIQKIITRQLVGGEDLCSRDAGHDHSSDEQSPEPIPVRMDGRRICVTAQGPDLNAEVDPRFGRARYFLFIEPETMDINAVENPHQRADQGAGIQAAEMIAEKDPGVVLTGHVGPNAEKVLQAAGIAARNDISGTVRDAVERFKREG